MGVVCQILINKPREGVHMAGQEVSGTVRYTIEEPTEYKYVTLSLVGEGKCSWSESDSSDSSKSTTYWGSECYVTTKCNLLNKRSNDTVTLEPGFYEYPFQFHLPKDIPTSFNTVTGKITYTIALKFEKPSFFSRDEKFSTELRVYGYVEPTVEGPVIFGLEKTLFKLFAAQKPRVNLKAEIQKCFLTPGENAHLTLVVTNRTGVDIPTVRCELYCYLTYTSNSNHTNRSIKKMKGCESHTEGVAAGEVVTTTVIVPTLPELYTIQHSKIIVREYKVRVVVKLPRPHINAAVEVPVVIGERRRNDEEFHQYPEHSPPPYWEAMCEIKE